MKQVKVSLFALVINLFLVTNLFAATSAKVLGKVTDALTDESLPGANVMLEGTALGAATDRYGKYYIPKVPTGVYTMLISYIGYKNVRVQN